MDTKRSESPGYFTLSDSDNSESPTSTLRAKSEPRGHPKFHRQLSLNRPYKDEPPARPPPPILYTSTLPPPVPKKARQHGYVRVQPALVTTSVSRKALNPNPVNSVAPLPPRPKPLQKIQPLQIQSPSIIKVFKSTEKIPHSCSSDDNTQSSLEYDSSANENFDKKKARRRSENDVLVKNFQNAANQKRYIKPLDRPRTDALARPRRPPSEPSKSPIKSIKVTTSKCTEPKVPSTCSSRSNSTVSNCSQKSESKKTTKPQGKRAASSVKAKTRNKTASSCSSASDDETQKVKPKSAAENLPQKIKKSVEGFIKTSSNAISKTVKEDPVHRRKLHASIHKLIKFYEPNFKSKSPILSEDKDDVKSQTASFSSGRLSQLSIQSLERINSWLTNPLETSLDDKADIDVLDEYINDMLTFTNGALPDIKTPRTSIVEIVLQNNTFKKEAIEEDERIPEGSVQEIIKKIECGNFEDELQSSVIIASNPEPSDDDLSRGCFTEVSCAGKVVVQKPNSLEIIGQTEVLKPGCQDLQPVPSPRVKRKARKEKMLMEHKANGKEALSQLKKIEEKRLSGLDDLNDLCAQSQLVRKDIEVRGNSKISYEVIDKTNEPPEVRESANGFMATCLPDTKTQFIFSHSLTVVEKYHFFVFSMMMMTLIAVIKCAKTITYHPNFFLIMRSNHNYCILNSKKVRDCVIWFLKHLLLNC